MGRSYADAMPFRMPEFRPKAIHDQPETGAAHRAGQSISAACEVQLKNSDEAR